MTAEISGRLYTSVSVYHVARADESRVAGLNDEQAVFAGVGVVLRDVERAVLAYGERCGDELAGIYKGGAAEFIEYACGDVKALHVLACFRHAGVGIVVYGVEYRRKPVGRGEERVPVVGVSRGGGYLFAVDDDVQAGLGAVDIAVAPGIYELFAVDVYRPVFIAFGAEGKSYGIGLHAAGGEYVAVGGERLSDVLYRR